MSRILKSTTLAAAIALSMPFAAVAAGENKPMPAKAGNTYSDRAVSKDLNADRDALQQSILTGQSIDQIKNKLSSMGYQITAVNDSEKDYVEYEVVKGKRSYEVQVDLDANAKSKKVDIAPNLWRASSTKAALRGEKVAAVSGKDSSDRMYMKAWNDEKDALEKALGTGHSASAYKSKLTQMGYQITATNDAEKDYLEYEIAKGKNSYEVQIDLDAQGMGKKVDVTSNLWEADRTDKRTDQAKAKMN
jgi:ribosomal protein S6